jgi:hypothetical protein
VYITLAGLRALAHRPVLLDGITVDQEPTLDKDTGEWVARVTVYRKDMSHGFTYPGRYPANGGNRQYAPEMALKAAEAHALRRAFEVTGLPTLDERKPAQTAEAPKVSAADFTSPPAPEAAAEVVEEDVQTEEPPAEPFDPEAQA